MRSIQYNNLDVALFARARASPKAAAFAENSHKRRSVISELLLRSFRSGDRISNDFTDYGDDTHVQLHYGICTPHKTHPEYALPFNAFVPGFVGLVDKIFHDTNCGDPELDPIPYVLTCVGSWRHDLMAPQRAPSPNRWARVRERLRLPDVRPPIYKANATKAVYFLSNVGANSYWFGWTERGALDWQRRELIMIGRAIRDAPVHVTLHIKPHPLMSEATLAHFLSCADIPRARVYARNCSLDDVLDGCAYGVVNTGTAFYHLLTRGVPIVCMDDTYSILPVSRFAIRHPRCLAFVSKALPVDKLQREMDALSSRIVLEDEFDPFVSELRV